MSLRSPERALRHALGHYARTKRRLPRLFASLELELARETLSVRTRHTHGARRN